MERSDHVEVAPRVEAFVPCEMTSTRLMLFPSFPPVRRVSEPSERKDRADASLDQSGADLATAPDVTLTFELLCVYIELVWSDHC